MFEGRVKVGTARVSIPSADPTPAPLANHEGRFGSMPDRPVMRGTCVSYGVNRNVELEGVPQSGLLAPYGVCCIANLAGGADSPKQMICRVPTACFSFVVLAGFRGRQGGADRSGPSGQGITRIGVQERDAPALRPEGWRLGLGGLVPHSCRSAGLA